MNEIRKSVTIPLKNKLIINYTKIKNSETKGPSNFSPRKNKLIKLKTNYIENSNKKTQIAMCCRMAILIFCTKFYIIMCRKSHFYTK